MSLTSVLFGHAGPGSVRDELAQLTFADEAVEARTGEESDELCRL